MGMITREWKVPGAARAAGKRVMPCIGIVGDARSTVTRDPGAEPPAIRIWNSTDPIETGVVSGATETSIPPGVQPTHGAVGGAEA
jgi:hypothetical protein